MKNPYLILGVKQDATKSEIMKAQMLAMKNKTYSLQEIQVATKQLLNPAKRLAADFMLSSKIKARRIVPIQSDLTYKTFHSEALSFNENAFDSLK